jgi:hypothetical protein|tara:strand:- start:823 stop:1002 length:180 start_codon:yes stop_codon:yes gene_type:complete
MVDTTETNGTLYIGQANGKDGFYVHQATIDGDHYIESAVLAGPVSFPGTITVTGNLVIV